MNDYQRQLEIEVERSRLKHQEGLSFRDDRTDLIPSYASLQNCVENEENAWKEAVEDYRSIYRSSPSNRSQEDLRNNEMRAHNGRSFIKRADSVSMSRGKINSLTVSSVV